MTSQLHAGSTGRSGIRLVFVGIMAVGFTGLILLVWWPSRPDASNNPESITTPLQSRPAEIPVREEISRATMPRSRQLIQVLEWIPGGFPLALALDLGALRKFAWTRSFWFLVNNPVVRRHLDVLQIDADGFELLGIGLEPSRSPVSWTGRSLQFAFVPHVFLLRGREGRMDLLRRFWQSRQGTSNIQVGQYLLYFPMQHEPHLVVGAWKADLSSTVGLVERTQQLQNVCDAVRCRTHFVKLQSWAHLLGVFTPRTPLRLSPSVQIRSILVAGEWNPDGLLLQADILLKGNCVEAIPVLKEFLKKNINAWQLDDVFFKRAHFGCGSLNELHITLPVSVHEIQNQLMLFGQHL
ncbi:hypothetical protein KJ975_03385 [Myxococcota bacterium]|nr:hypothetical protein [Myxococcota bacterium]